MPYAPGLLAAFCSCAARARSATGPRQRCDRRRAARAHRGRRGARSTSGRRRARDASARRVLEAERVVSYCADRGCRSPSAAWTRPRRSRWRGLACQTRRDGDAAALLCSVDALLRARARRAPPPPGRCPSRSCPPRCWRWSSRARPRRGAARPSLCDAAHMRCGANLSYPDEHLFDRRVVSAYPEASGGGSAPARRRSDGRRAPRSVPWLSQAADRKEESTSYEAAPDCVPATPCMALGALCLAIIARPCAGHGAVL